MTNCSTLNSTASIIVLYMFMYFLKFCPAQTAFYLYLDTLFLQYNKYRLHCQLNFYGVNIKRMFTAEQAATSKHRRSDKWLSSHEWTGCLFSRPYSSILRKESKGQVLSRQSKSSKLYLPWIVVLWSFGAAKCNVRYSSRPEVKVIILCNFIN